MSDESTTSPSQAPMAVAIVFAILVLYVLSVGPVGAVVEHSGRGQEVASIFYAPLTWLHQNTVLKRPLEEYARLWGWGPARP
jgi:hypothetical protein